MMIHFFLSDFKTVDSAAGATRWRCWPPDEPRVMLLAWQKKKKKDSHFSKNNKWIFILLWLSWLLVVGSIYHNRCRICALRSCVQHRQPSTAKEAVWRRAPVCQSPSLFSALSTLGPESLLTSSTNCFEVNSPQFVNLHKLFLQPRSIQLIFMEILFLRKKLEKPAPNRWCQNLPRGTSTRTMNKRLNLWVCNVFVWALTSTCNIPPATLTANSHTLFVWFLMVTRQTPRQMHVSHMFRYKKQL